MGLTFHSFPLIEIKHAGHAAEQQKATKADVRDVAITMSIIIYREGFMLRIVACRVMQANKWQQNCRISMFVRAIGDDVTVRQELSELGRQHVTADLGRV